MRQAALQRPEPITAGTPGVVGQGRSLPPALSSVIGDGVLRMAESEAGLLALMSFEFEARHKEKSFKKEIAAVLRVTERYIGDMLHGKANATPRQLRTIAQACGTLLFERWLQIHFITGGEDAISQS